MGSNIAFCDLKEYVIDENENLDCSNYCGTHYEECNSTYIGSASCSDVGCGGGGRPSCTNQCTLDYTECLPSVDELSFQFEMKTDNMDGKWTGLFSRVRKKNSHLMEHTGMILRLKSSSVWTSVVISLYLMIQEMMEYVAVMVKGHMK